MTTRPVDNFSGPHTRPFRRRGRLFFLISSGDHRFAGLGRRTSRLLGGLIAQGTPAFTPPTGEEFKPGQCRVHALNYLADQLGFFAIRRGARRSTSRSRVVSKDDAIASHRANLTRPVRASPAATAQAWRALNIIAER
jgi:hypothetical protein